MDRPLVLIRADASSAIGSGHVMRCLTLAHELCRRGARVVLASADTPGDLAAVVEAAGVARVAVTAPASSGDEVAQTLDARSTLAAIAPHGKTAAIVVDHYRLGVEWERAMRAATGARILVIDDLADRPHDCAFLLDQNLHEDMDRRYDGLVPASCRLFLGPRYALLRQEFGVDDADVPERGPVGRLFVFFGGGDPAGVTVRALEALAMLGADAPSAAVVLTEDARGRDEAVRLAASLPGVTLHGRVEHVAPLMLGCGLALAAGGSSTWERCRLALPSIVLSTAANQVEPARALAAAGAAWYIGDAADLTAADIAAALERAASAPSEMRRMAHAARALVGAGDGAALVADVLLAAALDEAYALRPMTSEDLGLVRAWRSSPQVRRRMFTDHEIGEAEHAEWWVRVSADPTVALHILTIGGRPAGLVTFADIDHDAGRAEWGFYLGEPHVPPGSGARMLALAADLAFREMGLRCIVARTFASNERALAVQKRLGMRETARVASGGREGGESEVVLLELDRDEWERVRGSVRTSVFGEG